jgi:acetyltransferase-like isoleucine patch superfamily enzyme
MRGFARAVLGGAAALLSMFIRIGRPLAAPLVRLVRLARLKASSSGRIPASVQFDGPVRTAGRADVTLGEECRLGRDVFFETGAGARITVGARVRINAGAFLVANAGISVGDDTLIGEYACLRDANHGTAADRPMREQTADAAPIAVGKDVWIGRGASILRGVRIGDGAVVGAGSVVTKDVEPMTVVAGCPARVLRRRGEGKA